MRQPIFQSIPGLIRARFLIALFFSLLLLPSLTIWTFQNLAPSTASVDEQNVSKTAESQRYRRSEHRYSHGDFELLDRDGNSVRLQEVLGNDEGVLLNFIFTDCTTLCPLMSASFAKVQEKLGPERNGLRLVSISIDPDHDTPQHLTDYWRRFGAGSQWQLLTGNRDDVIAIQKAFGVYLGKKSSHQSVIFLKASPDAAWVRLEGYPSAVDILAEYDRLTGRCQNACS